MNSFNHYAYGAIGQWMYERVAGLAPDPAHPGYKHFFVRPLIGEQLDSARAELETPYGKASSAWIKQGEKLVMRITVQRGSSKVKNWSCASLSRRTRRRRLCSRTPGIRRLSRPARTSSPARSALPQGNRQHSNSRAGSD